MLKTYFDGSCKSGHEQCQFLTLGGIFAADPIWVGFKSKWCEALKRHHVPYSHMRELLGNYGPFTGWSECQKVDFVLDLLRCLTHEGRGNFIACSSTVYMPDFRRIATGRAVKPAEAVCIDFCMTHVFGHPDFVNGRAEVFFDKGEEFIRWLERIWSKNKSNASSWAAYISKVAPAEMIEAVPIQAADLLAWGANRRYSSTNQEFWKSIQWSSFIAMDHYHKLYKEPELLQHPGFLDWNE